MSRASFRCSSDVSDFRVSRGTYHGRLSDGSSSTAKFLSQNLFDWCFVFRSSLLASSSLAGSLLVSTTQQSMSPSFRKRGEYPPARIPP